MDIGEIMSSPENEEKCHCGQDIHIYEDLDGFTRNMCEECSRVRCDIIAVCPVLTRKMKF